MIRDPWEGKLESGLADMHEFHLKHHRKELERIGERMQAKKPEDLILQLAEDASHISSTACHLMEEAGTIEFSANQMSNKIHAYASMKTTMKTKPDVAGLEANVASLNEVAAKIIKSAAEVSARLAEMNVNMMRISAEVNDATAIKAKEDVGDVLETAKQEWRRRNKTKSDDMGDCDFWGNVGPRHTNISKKASTLWPELERLYYNTGMDTTTVDHSEWATSMGSHHGSIGGHEPRRSQKKGFNAAPVDHSGWDTNTVSNRGSVDSYERRRGQNKGLDAASADTYGRPLCEEREEKAKMDSWI